MKINVHAGHNPDGMAASGACGYIKESTAARDVKDLLIKKLREAGHVVFDCTVNDGKSATDVLQKIVDKCNRNEVDLDISIHFNACVNEKERDGKTTGTLVYTWSASSRAYPYAKSIVDAIAALGFRNRGVEFRPTLYVIKNTAAPALLIECCFVDDPDDADLYTAESMSNAIYKGITGNEYIPQSGIFYKVTTPNVWEKPTTSSKKVCSVKSGSKLEGLEDAPIIADSQKWIRVRTESGQIGWIKYKYLTQVK